MRIFYFLNYSYILESWSLGGLLAGRLLDICRTFGWSLVGLLAGHFRLMYLEISYNFQRLSKNIGWSF